MRYLCTFVILLVFSPASSAESLTERRISSADIGTVVFLAPEKWKGFESYDELEAASVYEISSRREKFTLKLSVKHVGIPLRDDEIIPRLDAYLQYAIADYLDNADRYDVRAARFSPDNHGIYARITDRYPHKGSFRYYSHGARVMDEKFIVFSLDSNDDDLSVLRTALDIVTSFDAKKEWADAPDSYLCEAEQLVGFGIVEKEWDAVTSKKVKQSILLRRSRPGDAFADTSEWVFLGTDVENANSACDNESISIGLFVCGSAGNEEFRMDSRTLRFVYAHLGGYHDVPAEVIPEDKDPKPALVIGTCVAQ